MQDQPPVTWLMSVRNGMPFLPETLRSIARQTYRNHKLLVWDDASEDGTRDELDRWIPSQIPGHVFTGSSFRLGPNLAFLVDQADTELCARIDADDINFPDRLARQVDFLQRFPRVGILGAQADFIDHTGKPISGWSFASDDATVRWRCHWMTHLAHSAVLFRKSIILAAGNYRDNRGEDMDLWIRAARLTEIVNLPDSLIQYRRSQKSLTGTIVDFKSLFREAALINAETLFPGIAAGRAMKLWDAAYPDSNPAPVQFRHFRELKQAAIALARQTGKPDDYFYSTSFFAEQIFHLRRRFLEQRGLGFLRRLRKPAATPVERFS